MVETRLILVPIISQDLEFQCHVLCSFYAISFMWEVIVRFADIGGIVDHQCLNFPFIIDWYDSDQEYNQASSNVFNMHLNGYYVVKSLRESNISSVYNSFI
jgi:hypothetical protein